MSEIEYSIVVPVFNSEATLKELNDQIHAVFQELKASFEIIFIEDGSKDNSWKMLTEIKSATPGTVTAIKLAKNFGQHNATFCGLNFAKGKMIITIDDDLQILPEEIKKIIACYQTSDSDLVYGCFQNKKHSLFRNIGSKLVKRSAKFFNDYPGEGSSFRLFSNELAKKILSHSQNFVFIDELLLWYTDNISFVKVDHRPSLNNHSGYTKTKLFQLTANLVIYYSILPLRLMTWGGFIFSVLSFLAGLFYLVKKFVFHHAAQGYTSIIVTILFSTSIIIFSLGIIGEYLNRIYMVQNKKPPYSVKKIL